MCCMDAQTRQKVIEAAGGRPEVGRHFGVSREAVRQWVRDGIPARRVLEVARMAGVSPSTLDPELYPPDVMDPEYQKDEAPAA